MEPLVTVLIPTFNNPNDLNGCVSSIINTGAVNMQFVEIVIINNGSESIKSKFADVKGVKVLEPGENLGWEGGLKLGIENSKSKFVCFMNDDTLIPKASQQFFNLLLMPFQDKKVGAVGPVTTTAAGIQSIFNSGTPFCQTLVKWMIFFTVMVRRSALEEVGGIDTTLPGGDDIDLSIRLRKAGYKLIVQPDAFLIHYGFHTGNRVHGDGFAGVINGWNSPEMTERTNRALINKHGFSTFFDTLQGQFIDFNNKPTWREDDIEGKLIAQIVKPDDKTLELGCGFRKTVPWAWALDRTPVGQPVPLLIGPPTMAVNDQVADVSKELPVEEGVWDVVIARHILEHCVDSIKTLRFWMKPLKPGGRLIIAVPDQQVVNGIPLSPDHVHAFDRESLQTLCETVELKHIESLQTGNNMSFIGVYEKMPVGTLDRLYEGDITTHAYKPELVRAD